MQVKSGRITHRRQHRAERGVKAALAAIRNDPGDEFIVYRLSRAGWRATRRLVAGYLVSETDPIQIPAVNAGGVKIRPKGGAKDCHLGWWSDLGVRLGVGDAVRGFFGGSGQRSHAELKRSAPAGRPQGGMVYRIGVSLATRALGARCRPGPSDGVPQFSYRHCFCGRGFG